MKMTINTKFGKAGCRENRDVEARTGETFVYSAWYYLPRREVPTNDMWTVFQFKSDSPSVVSIGTDPFWTINIVRSPSGRTSARVEMEGRTHGSYGRRIRSFRRFADPGANVPSAPHGRPCSTVVQDQRQTEAVWSVRRTLGRAPERRSALGHAASSHEVSGRKAELERRELLEWHSGQSRHDLHRRRERGAALAGSTLPSKTARPGAANLTVRREGPAGSPSRCCRR